MKEAKLNKWIIIISIIIIIVLCIYLKTFTRINISYLFIISLIFLASFVAALPDEKFAPRVKNN
jgi:uncharacterized membrane protein